MDLSNAVVIYTGGHHRILCDPKTHLHYIDIPGHVVRERGDCNEWIEFGEPHCDCRKPAEVTP